MFDTSIVRARTVAAPRRFGLFTASVAIHSAVVAAAVAMSIATVDFPGQAPDQLENFRPVAAVSLPPPLGSGPKQPAVKREPIKTDQVVVPREVPPETPALESVPGIESATNDTGSSDTDTGSGAGGDPLGVPDGLGDDPAGIAGAPGAGGPRVPGGEVRSARVLLRVEPRYPAAMIPARIRTAVVSVRCVIDRNGRVRDPEVLTSSWPAFDRAVLDAVKGWTFAPGTLRGQPIDTWFELTVTFRVR